MNTKDLLAEGNRGSSALRAIAEGWWIVALAALSGGLAGLFFTFMQIPMYASSATLYVTSGSDGNTQAAYQGSLASQQRVVSYAGLVTSDAVVESALRATDLSLSAKEAKNALSAKAVPDTVLLKLSAKLDDPVSAAVLVNAIALSMSDYVEVLETPSGGGDALAKLTVVSPGVEVPIPVEPRVKRTVGLSVVLGMMVGVSLVFLRSRRDTRIRSSDDLESVLGSRPLGVIPLVDGDSSVDLGVGASVSGEAYRKLRTNLVFSDVDNPPRTIVVSSANEGEGKTTTALSLAQALAEADSKVVLIDGDLRSQGLSQILPGSSSVGFTDYLRGSLDVGEVVQGTAVERLSFVAAGSRPPNPSELLASDKAAGGLKALAELYDYVVIDSPPLNPVTDAVVLGKVADGVLLVVRADQTRSQDVLSAVSELGASRATVLGGLLNAIPQDRLGNSVYYAVDTGRGAYVR